jgi:hypothetical protein
MNLDISLVPVGVIHKVLPQVIKYLEISEDWTRGRANVDDILSFILTGQMQLWVALDDSGVYGQLITEIKQYPRCKMLVVQYCSGEPNHMQYVEDKTYAVLEKFAKEHNCAGIELIGRPGWTKHVAKRGFNVKSVMYQKFFERGE